MRAPGCGGNLVVFLFLNGWAGPGPDPYCCEKGVSPLGDPGITLPLSEVTYEARN